MEWNGYGLQKCSADPTRIMNKMLDEFRGKGEEVYMDNIVVHARTEEEHDRLIMAVIKKLKENNMRINPKKIQFKQQ